MSNSSPFETSLLTVLFIGLKLADVIAWSWWWVLSPVWISVLVVVMMFCAGLFYGILRRLTQ